MKISVVIPTHNRSDALNLTLERLARQDFDPSEWEAIVVDNNSTDDTDAVVKTWQTKFPVPLRLESEKISGASPTRNAGARAATGEYLIFLDNDILVETDFVSRHFAALTSNPRCVILGAISSLPEQKNSLFGQYRERMYPPTPKDEPPSETYSLTGQIFSVKKSDFDAVGGFDAALFSSEDLDLAVRLRQIGLKILYYPSIAGVHNDWAGWTIEDYCRRFRIYRRSEIIFWRKHGKNHPHLSLVTGNLPPDLRRDGLVQTLKTRMKQAIGSDGGQKAVLSICSGLEKVLPVRPLVWGAYRVALAGAIYRGIQDAIAENPLSEEDLDELAASR